MPNCHAAPAAPSSHCPTTNVHYKCCGWAPAIRTYTRKEETYFTRPITMPSYGTSCCRGRRGVYYLKSLTKEGGQGLSAVRYATRHATGTKLIARPTQTRSPTHYGPRPMPLYKCGSYYLVSHASYVSTNWALPTYTTHFGRSCLCLSSRCAGKYMTCPMNY